MSAAANNRCLPASDEPMPRPPRFIDHLDLAAVPTATVCAHMFVAITFDRWGASSITSDALAVMRELVTDAVERTGTTDTKARLSEITKLNLIGVRILGFNASIVIEVWDCDPHLPAANAAQLRAKPSRDLHVVAETAHRWGVYSARGGTVVWAELVVPPRPTSAPLPPLPKRVPQPVPDPTRPAVMEHDPELLKRVMDGLRDLK